MTTMATDIETIRVTPRDEYAALFPLPLAPFELFLLQDERLGYPMTFCVEMVFLGRMNRSILAQAVAEAAARHPLLLARIQAQPKGWEWVLAGEQVVPIESQSADAPFFPPRGAAIDLRIEAGLRVWVREDDQRTSVTFQFHHACCDGEGSRHFGHDVLTAYTRLVTGADKPEWTRVDYERLRQRAIFLPPTLDAAQATTSTWQKLKDAYHFHVLGPSELAVPRSDPAESVASGRSLVIKKLFTRPETAQIEAKGAGSERMLNDVAVALLFRVLADWNRRVGGASARQRLRVLMPTDLRERADRWMTAANRTSFSFMTRTLAQCSDWSELLAGIARETQYIKRIRLGLDFINIMAGVQRVPGLFPLLLRLPRCMSTAVLTNLGDTTRRFRRRFALEDGYPVIGDVRLEQVVGAPPLRPRTHAGFGICFCAGHMAISLRPDTAVLSGDAARELLDAYVDAWRRWADMS